jgi:hypothetical protein
MIRTLHRNRYKWPLPHLFWSLHFWDKIEQDSLLPRLPIYFVSNHMGSVRARLHGRYRACWGIHAPGGSGEQLDQEYIYIGDGLLAVDTTNLP